MVFPAKPVIIKAPIIANALSHDGPRGQRMVQVVELRRPIRSGVARGGPAAGGLHARWQGLADGVAIRSRRPAAGSVVALAYREPGPFRCPPPAAQLHRRGAAVDAVRARTFTDRK